MKIFQSLQENALRPETSQTEGAAGEGEQIESLSEKKFGAADGNPDYAAGPL